MIIRSPHPDVTISDLPLTEYVLEYAPRWPDKSALIDGTSGRIITYRELSELIDRAATGLLHHGFTRGETLAIFSPNVPEYAVAFHAAAKIGGTVTTINPLYTATELQHQMEDAGAKFLITVPQFIDKAVEAARLAQISKLFVFGDADGAMSFDSLYAFDPITAHAPVDVRNDVVALPYSSGTTGVPKGVMLTHFNMVANLCQMSTTERIRCEDTLIGVLPFFHIYGMNVIMNMGLRQGATIVTLPRFDLEQFLETIQTFRVTRAHVVPPIVLALARNPIVDRFDLSSLRIVMSAAAPLRADLLNECSARLGKLIKQGYGMTEASPATHMDYEDDGLSRPGSVGVPVPNTQVKLVDPANGESRRVGEEGEICVRGPQIMKGYLNQPASTALTIDDDGWLHTGDIGHIDDDGYFWIVDRVKELIKYKGFQVAPAELEALLLTHPAVADVAVIPFEDDEAGELPKAFVVRRSPVEAEELMLFVASQVAPFKKVRRLEFVDQIPKSPSGKILRRVLRDRDRAEGRVERATL